MTRPRVAVIGAGNWGRNHVRTLAALPEAELVAVCDADPDRRRNLAEQYPGVTLTDSVEETLELADGVVVATPAATHAAIGLAALDRGKPVLIEKPMALSVDDAVRIVELAEATGTAVVSGHLLLFHPAVRYLRGMLEAGELGDLMYLYSQRVNLGQVRQDENALWSFGPHDISVAIHLVGELPIRVAAHGHGYLQPGVEDVVFLMMEFRTGVMAHVQMSWLDPHKERRLTVVGSSKMVVFDDMQPREKIKVYDKGIDRPPDYGSYGESLAVREGDILSPRIENLEPLRAELRHFAAVVAGEERPISDAQNGLQVVRVLEAASTSLASGGRAVELDSAGVTRT